MDKKLFPNPFYVLLLVASSLFVLTVLGYLISALIPQEAVSAGPQTWSLWLASWLDRRGPLALGIEVALMIATGLLAMVTDRWFPEVPARHDTNSSRVDRA
ncbi:MAG: hypothetical protein NVSMB9_20160 [Isosphaeraceae bacterium]